MSDRITDKLRNFYNSYDLDWYVRCTLDDIANGIDAAHEERMKRSRYETRRAVLRYLGGVLNDYKKGIKRVRKCDKDEVVRCRDCEYAIDDDADNRYVCVGFASRTVDGDGYCSHGERRKDEDE